MTPGEDDSSRSPASAPAAGETVSAPVPAPAPSGRRWPGILARWGTAAVVLAGLTHVAMWEMRTSTLQARFFADWAAQLDHQVRTEPATASRYPRTGPSDIRMGYTRMPEFLDSLAGRGYVLTAQAQQSPALQDFMDRGFFPPYPERTQAGLRVLDCRGEPLFRSRFPLHTYAGEAQVPPVVARMLGFIENREVLDESEPRHNPAIEWTRLGKAVVDQVIAVADDDHAAAGRPGGQHLERHQHQQQ